MIEMKTTISGVGNQSTATLCKIRLELSATADAQTRLQLLSSSPVQQQQRRRRRRWRQHGSSASSSLQVERRNYHGCRHPVHGRRVRNKDDGEDEGLPRGGESGRRDAVDTVVPVNDNY